MIKKKLKHGSIASFLRKPANAQYLFCVRELSVIMYHLYISNYVIS